MSYNFNGLTVGGFAPNQHGIGAGARMRFSQEEPVRFAVRESHFLSEDRYLYDEVARGILEYLSLQDQRPVFCINRAWARLSPEHGASYIFTHYISVEEVRVAQLHLYSELTGAIFNELP